MKKETLDLIRIVVALAVIFSCVAVARIDRTERQAIATAYIVSK